MCLNCDCRARRKIFSEFVSLNYIWIVVTLFQLIWHQIEFRLLQDQSEKVITIQIQFRLTRFRKEISACCDYAVRRTGHSTEEVCAQLSNEGQLKFLGLLVGAQYYRREKITSAAPIRQCCDGPTGFWGDINYSPMMSRDGIGSRYTCDRCCFSCLDLALYLLDYHGTDLSGRIFRRYTSRFCIQRNICNTQKRFFCMNLRATYLPLF